MTSMRMSFCVKAATGLYPQDLEALTTSIETYARNGVNSRQAEAMAVDDLMAGIAAERAEIMALAKAQHPDAFEAKEASAISTEPQR